MGAEPVPDDVLARASEICLALPDATLRSDRFAHAFERKRKVFCYLFAFDGVTSMALQADPDERRALLAEGHPYWAPDERRLGVVIETGTDWDQVAELVNDSYELVTRRR